MEEAIRIMLQAVTRAERHTAITMVRDALQAGGADITDYHLFSNTAVNISFEIAGANARRLRESLISTGLAFDADGIHLLATQHEGEMNGSLHLAFIHNDPDLRIPVPPIPG